MCVSITMDLFYVDSAISTFIVFMCTFLLIYLTTRRQNGVPPGPALFPIVGNMPSLMSSDVLGKISQLRKRYGDIFALYIGGRLTIFLNGFEAIDDAFKKRGSLFKRRPLSPMYLNDKGIVFSNDETWKEQRNFAQHGLHEIGFGTNSRYLDVVINSEINELINKICTKEGAFDVEKYLNISISNVVLRLLCNKRYDFDDLEINNFLARLRDSAKTFFIRDAIVSCFPNLARFPVLRIKDKTFEKQLNFIDKCIESEKEIPKAERNSFARMYFEKIHENRVRGLQQTYDFENVRITAFQFLAAGSETTAGSVRWILLHLIRRPNIQEIMANEIEAILGTEDLTISDRKRLPYTYAVILEGLRIAGVAPLGMPHSVSQDVMFHGFLFPKNCTVLANLSSCLNDPHVWKDPEEFCPDRFLSKDGKSVIIPKEFIPFSLGARSCLGETLARNEVFLYVARIVRKFRLYPENESCLPDVQGVMGVTYHPVAFKMRFVPRQV